MQYGVSFGRWLDTQINGIKRENPNSYMYAQLIFDKGKMKKKKQINRENKAFSTIGTGTFEYPQTKIINFTLNFPLYTKINSKQSMDLYVEEKTTKLFKEKRGKCSGSRAWGYLIKAQSIKEKLIVYIYLTKIREFFFTKDL